LVGFPVLNEFYEFFIPLSYRVSAIGSGGNSIPEVFALLPWDYISQGATLTVGAVPAAMVAEMAGAVRYSSGYKNVGPWVKWPAH